MQSLDKERLPYRIGVKAILLDNDNNILLLQEAPYKANEWGFPGGGSEQDETPEQTIIRELKEELTTDKFKILFKSAYTFNYDWPDEHIELIYKQDGIRYRGQLKYQFAIRFTGAHEDISIGDKQIKQLKWVTLKDLESHLIFPKQWERAQEVLKELEQKGYLQAQ